MSYFGKKALVWWDYNEHSKEKASRYANSNPEMQLEILNKWYPKGMKFRKMRDDRVYEITNYIQIQKIWFIEYNVVAEITHEKFQYSQYMNPVIIIPLEEFSNPLKRNNKIDRLLKYPND